MIDPRADEVSTVAAPLVCRGVRGATTVSENTAEEILEATSDLLTALIRLNQIEPEDVVSAIFTTTTDLTASFPALAARDLGWTEVPLLCTHEMAVPGALGRVVRILLHINTTRGHAEVRHVYAKDARALRPEWGFSESELRAIVDGSPVLAGNSV
jgi:chorismate mutase